MAHKLALVLRSAADDHADWRLPELTSELAVIARNERRFIGFSSDDAGFDPERHRITSYNVCYTKLLRSFYGIFGLWQK